MSHNPDAVFSSYTGEEYDRLQPLRIDMYRFYHELAFEFMPFETNEPFRMLDLGPGTSVFLESILRHYPNASARAIEYARSMIDFSTQKLSPFRDRFVVSQGDLGEGLPDDIGRFEFVSSFSAIHHLTEANKQKLYCQIYDVLEPGGWFFLMDAMIIYFEDRVFALGRERHQMRLQQRLAEAGIDPSDIDRIDRLTKDVDEDAPDRDRPSRLDAQITWLKQAGFSSVDHIWHLWMEHFIICRK